MGVVRGTGPQDTCNQTAAAGRSASPSRWVDGRDLADMVVGGLELLESHSHIVNALNVFPVPDGDTGTNMSLTMRAVAESARQQAGSETRAESVARAMARRALMEARGNSGVILSQFFRGISEGLSGRDRFDAGHLAAALEAATERSYGAVGEPVEGTMLTVISAAAREARRSVDAGLPILETMDCVCDVVEETVEATEGMLPVLTEAGVVDSGGFGVQLILRGMAIRLAGGSVSGVEVPVPGGGTLGSSVALNQAFLDRTEHIGFGYCTQLLVRADCAEGSEPDLDEIRRRAGDMASSVVVVGDAELVKIHVHTEQPDSMVAFAQTLGEVIERNIQDMDEQRSDFATAHRVGSAQKENVSLVVVALGAGFAQVFAELGCTEVVSGGPTMNPSVKDISEAIDRAPAEAVIVLPNEGNVIATARQAEEISVKDVLVIPTTSVQQGIAAALAFDASADLESNSAAMSEAPGEVRSAGVTVATRDVTLHGVTAEEGGYIGLLDGELAASGDSLSGVLDALMIAAGVSGDDLVTLFRGEQVSESESGAEMSRLQSRFEGAEFELVEGGQPHYHYLISIE